MIIATLFLVGGISRIVAASAIKFRRWGWTVFAGMVSMVLGGYRFANWAGASTFFIGMAIGIDFIFDGGALLGFAAAVRSLPVARTRTA